MLLWPSICYSQPFWSLTNEFWGGPKTGIGLLDDTVFFVATKKGILKSVDDGEHFEQVLEAFSVYTMFVSSSGNVYAGGNGKIYFSTDKGTAWDSVSLNTNYPVIQFAESGNGGIFAITRLMDNGDGVFYLENNGNTWQARNNGLGYKKGCESIAVDKYNRLYLAITDENATGNGGLFISESDGLLWEKINLTVDSINGPLRTANITGLSISPDDSIYISFTEIGSNFLMKMNLRKSLHDIKSGNSWLPLLVSKSSSWWEDKALNNIHFAKNGDWYSSSAGTVNTGATCFSTDKGRNWFQITDGLGLSETGFRTTQHFVENSKGYIYMVQYLDERIYKTDKSLHTSNKPYLAVRFQVQVYPNPVKAGEKVFLRIPVNDDITDFSLYDLSGQKIYSEPELNRVNEFIAPYKTGIYIVKLKGHHFLKTEKLIVIRNSH